VGARPLATTDNLNFGNPEKPEIMGQFVGAIKGIGAACTRARHADRLGQRLALQRDRRQAILPTPTIGAVGLIWTSRPTHRRHARDGHVALLMGETNGPSRASPRCCAEVFNREDGDAPHVDLDAEKRNGDFIRAPRLDQGLHRPQRRRPRARRLRDGGGRPASASRSTPPTPPRSSARTRAATSSPATSTRPRR
jgi:phosphoribosylformylglycinamidine (FGAM) synthase-like enzyme